MSDVSSLTDKQLSVFVTMEMRSRGRIRRDITPNAVKAGIEKARELNLCLPWPANPGRYLDEVYIAAVDCA